MAASSKFVALYRLLLGQQVTKARLVLVGAFTIAMVAIGFAISQQTDFAKAELTEAVVGFISVVGLGLLVPILCLVFSAATFGQLIDDETLVYLWLRPYPRWILATAAWLASLTIALPAVVVPSVAAALVGTRGDLSVAWAIGFSSALAAVGYTVLFTLLGATLRRSLEFGLVYVFIWELFVARAGAGAAKLSLNSYPSSVLRQMTEVDLPQADRSLVAGILVPLLLVPVVLALTTWRLRTMDVA